MVYYHLLLGSLVSLNFNERLISPYDKGDQVISMYTKSEIEEISMEIDQCMCCAAMVPIDNIGVAV